MIYLDNAATTFQKPAAVQRAVMQAMRTMSSPGRGGYAAAQFPDFGFDVDLARHRHEILGRLYDERDARSEYCHQESRPSRRTGRYLGL